MASKEQIAIKQQRAFDRIKVAMDTIADATGIAVNVLPRAGRDPAFTQAQQLEQVADYLDAIAAWLTQLVPESTPDPAFVATFTDDPVVIENDPPVPDDAPKARRKGR